MPVYNESDSLPALVAEVNAQASALDCNHEIIVVDDGSSDATPDLLVRLSKQFRQLVTLRSPRNEGQSMAIYRGVLAASAEWVLTLDGDGQNVPADIALLLAALSEAEVPKRVGMVVGCRTERNDSWIKRVSSRIANRIRRRLLHDGAADTGCGIKLIRRDLFMRFPKFDHMHRFLPALAIMHGAEVIPVPVHHRARTAGVSKYGILDRLGSGVLDLLGVMWLRHRALDRNISAGRQQRK